MGNFALALFGARKNPRFYKAAKLRFQNCSQIVPAQGAAIPLEPPARVQSMAPDLPMPELPKPGLPDDLKIPRKASLARRRPASRPCCRPMSQASSCHEDILARTGPRVAQPSRIVLLPADG